MTARFLQRVFRQRDGRRLETILREDGSGGRSVRRDDQAEVGALLANAGADAGGEETFGSFIGIDFRRCEAQE